MGLQQCLNRDDDVSLLSRYHRDRDPQALEAIINRYRSFARVRARSYFLIGGDRDDVEQEALIGLYKAIRDFRPGHDANFRGFAELCIRRQIITAIKSATRQKHRPLNSYLSISTPDTTEEPGETSVEAQLAIHSDEDPADALVEWERQVTMRRSVGSVLSGLELDVLGLYLEGCSYEEMSETLGRQTKAIDNALQRIKRKLGGGLVELELIGPRPLRHRVAGSGGEPAEASVA